MFLTLTTPTLTKRRNNLKFNCYYIIKKAEYLVSEKIYKQAQAAGQNNTAAENAKEETSTGAENNKKDVVDVDYTDVDEEKK